jgi:hypothetical protein
MTILAPKVVSFKQFHHPLPIHPVGARVLFDCEVNQKGQDTVASQSEQTLTHAEQSRIEAIISRIVGQVMEKSLRECNADPRWHRSPSNIVKLAQTVVNKAIKELITISKLPPKVLNHREIAAKARLKARKKVKEILPKINAKKKILLREVDSLEEKKHQLLKDVMCIEDRISFSIFAENEGFAIDLPPVPVPWLDATETGEGLPEASGIYFVWERTELVYVGLSINLKSRVRTGSHGKIFTGDRISYREFPPDDLKYVEAFYIGATKPARNFNFRRDSQE